MPITKQKVQAELKVQKVINSCETADHLKAADRMIDLYTAYYDTFATSLRLQLIARAYQLSKEALCK